MVDPLTPSVVHLIGIVDFLSLPFDLAEHTLRAQFRLFTTFLDISLPQRQERFFDQTVSRK